MVVSVDMAEVVFDDDDKEQGEDLFVCVLRFPLSRGRPMGPGMAGTHHAPVRRSTAAVWQPCRTSRNAATEHDGYGCVRARARWNPIF